MRTGSLLLEPAPSDTIRGARDLLSVGLQYGNAFGRGFQAAALKPADFFGNDDVLYLMEDMATGEIRLSILWEWLHKGAKLTEDDSETGHEGGRRGSDGESVGALARGRVCEAAAKRAIVTCTMTLRALRCRLLARSWKHMFQTSPCKPPWYIDLLNLNLNNHDLAEARERIRRYVEEFARDGTRITGNLDFV